MCPLSCMPCLESAQRSYGLTEDLRTLLGSARLQDVAMSGAILVDFQCDVSKVFYM